MKIYDDLKPLESRLAALELIIGACLCVLAMTFWYLQVLRNEHYRQLSEENRIREAIVKAPRGLVLDRNRRILAENRPSFSIILRREGIADLTATLEKIRRIPFLNIDTVVTGLAKYKSLPSHVPIVVKEDAGPAEVAFIEARRLELPELAVQVEFKRYYPSPQAVSPVLGYVSEVSEAQLHQSSFKTLRPGDLVGQAGLERRYDALLRGVDGRSREIVNSRGRKISELDRIEPTPGRTVMLTVDMQITEALRAAFQGKVGSAVLLDVRTGDVLALVSEPSYDSNVLTGHFSREEWMTILSNPYHPLQNRAINNVHSPGSTFKLTIAIGGLEEGIITPGTTFFCPGSATIYGHTFNCWKAGGHGTMNLHSAIVNSCNVYFYQVGKKLGIERIARYARILGFGSPTGVDLTGEQPGLVPDPQWKKSARGADWYPGETISVAIGQGSLLVSPLQMAYHAALIASSGHTFRPHVLRSYWDATGQVFPNDPREGARAVGISDAVFEQVRNGMWGAVNQGGTGYRAAVTGRDVCGKTGTVQVASKANLKNPGAVSEALKVHSWFVGFAPLDKPEVAVAVFVEHGGAGGEAAAPIAKTAFEAYFSLRDDRSKTSS